MAKTEALFVLIKSLSRNEKRYFKVFCKNAGEAANYLQLFDAIDNQETYDEAAVKKKFKGRAFIKQLHVTKNYLRRLILKSLRDFHAGISKSAELKDALRNVEILFNKELFALCEAELKRAEKIAGEFDLTTGMVEVWEWKRRLEQQARPHNHPAFAKLIEGQAQVIEILVNTNRYWQLTNNFTARLSMGQEADSPYMNLLQNPANAKTMEAKVLHYNSLYFKSLTSNNPNEAEGHLYSLVELLEENPRLLQHNMNLYASTVNNLISFLVFMKKHEEAMQLINRAKAIYAERKLVSENKTLLKQVLRTYNIELELYRDQKRYRGNESYLNGIDKFITQSENKMPPEYRLSFSFQLGYIHFMLKNYSRALHWVNRVLNNSFKGQRTDLQVQVRLLNLMVHFEQQNIFVLRHFVDSTRRYTNKVAAVQPHEQLLLKFFSKAGQAFAHQYKGLFIELYEQMFPSDKPPVLEQNSLDFIDYKTWIGEKIGR